MNEMQLMTYQLLLFIAYRIVNPLNKTDMEALDTFKNFGDEMLKAFNLKVDE